MPSVAESKTITHSDPETTTPLCHLQMRGKSTSEIVTRIGKEGFRKNRLESPSFICIVFLNFSVLDRCRCGRSKRLGMIYAHRRCIRAILRPDGELAEVEVMYGAALNLTFLHWDMRKFGIWHLALLLHLSCANTRVCIFFFRWRLYDSTQDVQSSVAWELKSRNSPCIIFVGDKSEQFWLF